MVTGMSWDFEKARRIRYAQAAQDRVYTQLAAYLAGQLVVDDHLDARVVSVQVSDQPGAVLGRQQASLFGVDADGDDDPLEQFESLIDYDLVSQRERIERSRKQRGSVHDVPFGLRFAEAKV